MTPATVPAGSAPILTPVRYRVTVEHERRDPIGYAFSQRSSTWLVDLDDVPTLPGPLRHLVAFRTADHLLRPGDLADTTLRAVVDGYLATAGVARPARVLMLANPRVLGYVFNPLSVFYCLDADGRTTHVIAEVRNTYRGKHSYLLEPDHHGRSETDKTFYVSPFYPVDGRYTMSLPTPGARLAVTVTMRREAERPFVALMTGTRVPDRPSSLWAALRTPLATRAVMFGIKRHGIRLYTKGLRPFGRRPQDLTTTADTEPTGGAARPRHGAGDTVDPTLTPVTSDRPASESAVR